MYVCCINNTVRHIAQTCTAGPHLGAQFAQLVKELRSEYAAAVTACAERIAGALFQRPGYSINATLHRHGISGTPSIMQQQVLPSAYLTFPEPAAMCPVKPPSMMPMAKHFLCCSSYLFALLTAVRNPSSHVCNTSVQENGMGLQHRPDVMLLLLGLHLLIMI